MPTTPTNQVASNTTTTTQERLDRVESGIPEFLGYLKTEGVRFTKSGDVEVVFLIPGAFKKKVMDVTDFFGMPLVVSCRIFDPEEDLQDDLFRLDPNWQDDE